MTIPLYHPLIEIIFKYHGLTNIVCNANKNYTVTHAETAREKLIVFDTMLNKKDISD